MSTVPFHPGAGGGAELQRALLRCQEAHERARSVRSALQGVLVATSVALWVCLTGKGDGAGPLRAFALGSWLAAALLLAAAWAVERHWAARRERLARAAGRP